MNDIQGIQQDVNAKLLEDEKKLEKGNENMEGAVKDTEDANKELLKKRAKMGSFNKLLKWIIFLFCLVCILFYSMFFWYDSACGIRNGDELKYTKYRIKSNKKLQQI